MWTQSAVEHNTALITYFQSRQCVVNKREDLEEYKKNTESTIRGRTAVQF